MYSKCNRTVVPSFVSDPRVIVTTIPNVGRNDQTFAGHIATHYATLASAVMFLKDSMTNDGASMRSLERPPRMMAMQLVRAGFACGRRPVSLLGRPASIWHSSAELGEFTMPSDYNTAHEQNIVGQTAAFRSPVQPLRTWLQQSGVLDPARYGRLSKQSLWPVCYGGTFAASRDSIRRTPQDSWHRLSSALSRGDNIEEGHYTERLWAVLLAPPLSRSEGAELRCAAGNVSASLTYRGLLVNCKCLAAGNCSREAAMPTVQDSAVLFERPIASINRSLPYWRDVLQSHCHGPSQIKSHMPEYAKDGLEWSRLPPSFALYADWYVRHEHCKRFIRQERSVSQKISIRRKTYIHTPYEIRCRTP